MKTTHWSRAIRIGVTLAALGLFGLGAMTGGLAGFVLLGLPAILLLAALWASPIAGLLASCIAKGTIESWQHREKTDLREIDQLMRRGENALASRQLEAIIAKEPHHTEARIRAVTLHHQQGQTEKARQLCLELIRRHDAPLLTIQTLMAQIGMTDPEIQEVSSVREREDKRQALLQTLRQNPENHWAAARLIELLINDFGDYAQAQTMLDALVQKPGAPLPFLETLRASLTEKQRRVK